MLFWEVILGKVFWKVMMDIHRNMKMVGLTVKNTLVNLLMIKKKAKELWHGLVVIVMEWNPYKNIAFYNPMKFKETIGGIPPKYAYLDSDYW